jgi:hypothetical protein
MCMHSLHSVMLRCGSQSLDRTALSYDTPTLYRFVDLQSGPGCTSLVSLAKLRSPDSRLQP